MIVKVAKEDKTELMSSAERDAFDAYMFDIKYPGTSIFVVNQLPDRFTIEVDVIVNKQIIDLTGSKIDNSLSKPVKEAILNFANGSEFGGVFSVNEIEDVIQAVDGVLSVRLMHISALAYSGNTTIVYDLASGINILQYVSEAGHISLSEDDLTINYS
ncbi:MAG: hypothetical protein R2764_01615 [Bacteroidales bacterium]